MRKVSRRTIGLLVALLVLVGAALAAWGPSWTAAARYRQHRDPESLYAAIYRNVRSGDTVEQVASVLGPGRELAEEQRQNAIRATRTFAQKGSYYPQGTQDTDTFVEYPLKNGGGIYLQFRDGRLINFNRDEFARYTPLVGAAG